MKAMSDYWVVGKKSDQRELYVILSQKNANLIEVNGEWAWGLRRSIEPAHHGAYLKLQLRQED